ncbi:MAG: hypothetical protein WC069_05630 [Candidatus Shapirobacteria bacterium]
MSVKNFFIIFIFLFLVHPITPSFAADTATSDKNSAIFKVFDNMEKVNNAALPGATSLERWSEDSNIAQAMSGFRILFGSPSTFITDFKKWLSNNGQGPVPQYPVGGALGTGTQMIGMLYTPAASGVEYIASLKDNVLGKPAYAQSPNGFGFKGIAFLLPLWKAFRNVVYVLSSILFVVIGLMIILRVKVSPQAVVTIQSAIPTVITSLILVTFSYAIAGLIIDLSNLIGGIMLAIIFNVQGINITTSAVLNPVAGLTSDLTYANYSFVELVNPGFANLANLLMSTAPKGATMMMISAQIGGVITGMILGGIFNFIGMFPTFYNVGDAIGQIVGGFLGLTIIPIIFGIIIGIWIIQMFFGMLTSYVTIIFKIITAPFEIGMGAFPNSKMGFSSWFMDVFANAMVFPIITIFFALLNTISWSIYKFGANAWAPGPISMTGFSSGGADNLLPEAVLSALISIAGLAMASKLPTLIPQYIFMIKPSPFGQAIGENLTKADQAVRGIAGGLAEMPFAPIKKAGGPDIGGFVKQIITTRI